MFITNAYADTVGGFDAIMQRPDFLIIGLMVVAMYFVMIRPQMKRQKELKAMMDALGKGDEVVTSGGILGKIVKVGDAYITLEIATGTEVLIQRSSVTLLLPKGSIKAL
ncbi:MAG TPA: preprotein translocase subunit YajC [Burkholderiaceae bacterium]|nr:preprotein translocase subunit YajC [Burkholderiaceae bacterium]